MNRNEMNATNVTDETVNEERGFWRDIICMLLALSFLLAMSYCFHIIIVSGHSMDGTLFDGQHLIMSTVAYDNAEPKRNDIVIAQPASLGDEQIVKRVVGLPGETLDIRHNVVYIDGKILNEPYILEAMQTDDLRVKIPEGKCFVMGDNRNNSWDSRSGSIGLIDDSELVGKIVVRFPF